MEPWLNCVKKLMSMLDARKDLATALDISIQKADDPEIKTLDDYYKFLVGLLSEIPKQRTMGDIATKFHYLISHSPKNILKNDEEFQAWLVEFSKSHGAFLDTIESAACLQTFINDPGYHIEEYDAGASGWMTFNQFFSRHVKPGKRPVADPCNDNIVVAATDSVFLGSWPIDDHSVINAKGIEYSIMQLLDDSPFKEDFRGGVFTHSYLDTNDYHRFHVPAGGTIKEVRKIPGSVVVDTKKKGDGSITTTNETGFQFRQTRGLVIIDSPIGLVAVLPIGMGHVSSVNLTAEKGTTLVKGQEFGYFSYGGSDMVMLFQAGRVEFTATSGKHYKQGEKIARTLAL